MNNFRSVPATPCRCIGAVMGNGQQSCLHVAPFKRRHSCTARPCAYSHPQIGCVSPGTSLCMTLPQLNITRVHPATGLSNTNNNVNIWHHRHRIRRCLPRGSGRRPQRAAAVWPQPRQHHHRLHPVSVLRLSHSCRARLNENLVIMMTNQSSGTYSSGNPYFNLCFWLRQVWILGF